MWHLFAESAKTHFSAKSIKSQLRKESQIVSGIHKCVIYTSAYNAEKTMRRTIDSILAQTYENWVYYVLDNGSTDSTGSIIQEYAANDLRIIPLVREQNMVHETGTSCFDVMREHSDEDFICFIDADDEYMPEFLEKTLAFAFEYGLDTAACGYDEIQAVDGSLNRRLAPKQNIIMDSSAAFDTHFTEYYRCMRTMWGKLYKIFVLEKVLVSDFTLLDLSYGGDTAFTVACFRSSERVGILSEALHRYYISAASISHGFDSRRVECICNLDDFVRKFLMEKCGRVSLENNNFLFIVYFNGIKNALTVLYGSKIPIKQKLSVMLDIFTREHTSRLDGYDGLKSEMEYLLNFAATWLINQSYDIKTNTEILTAMYKEKERLLSVLGEAGRDCITPGKKEKIYKHMNYL